MSFSIGDICITDPGLTAACYLIVGRDESNRKYPLKGINPVNKRRYNLPEESLVKIGELPPSRTIEQTLTILNSRPVTPSALSEEYQLGKQRAEHMAQHGPLMDRPRWELLARTKPGEDLLIVLDRDGYSKQVTFQYVLERGQKYVFLAANRDGKLYRYPLEVLLGPAQTSERIEDGGAPQIRFVSPDE